MKLWCQIEEVQLAIVASFGAHICSFQVKVQERNALQPLRYWQEWFLHWKDQHQKILHCFGPRVSSHLKRIHFSTSVCQNVNQESKNEACVRALETCFRVLVQRGPRKVVSGEMFHHWVFTQILAKGRKGSVSCSQLVWNIPTALSWSQSRKISTLENAGETQNPKLKGNRHISQKLKHSNIGLQIQVAKTSRVDQKT